MPVLIATILLFIYLFSLCDELFMNELKALRSLQRVTEVASHPLYAHPFYNPRSTHTSSIRLHYFVHNQLMKNPFTDRSASSTSLILQKGEQIMKVYLINSIFVTSVEFCFSERKLPLAKYQTSAELSTIILCDLFGVASFSISLFAYTNININFCYVRLALVIPWILSFRRLNESNGGMGTTQHGLHLPQNHCKY